MSRFIRRLWARISQPGTGGLIQPGDWRVLYPDGKRSRYMSHGDAQNMTRIFRGTVEWRGDASAQTVTTKANPDD